MEKKMSGTLVSKVLYEELREYLGTKRKKKCKIIDISIGDDFGGQMYAEMKKKQGEAETGIPFESIHYDQIELEELYAEIDRINKDMYFILCSNFFFMINFLLKIIYYLRI